MRWMTRELREREMFCFVFRDTETEIVFEMFSEKKSKDTFNIPTQNDSYSQIFLSNHRVLSTVTKEIARPEGAVFMIGLGVGFVACGLSFMKQSEESIRSSPFASKYLAHKLPALPEGQEKKAHH